MQLISRLLRCRASVESEHLPGHERRLVRSEIKRRETYIIRLTKPPNRLRVNHLLPVLLILPEILAEIRLHQSRRQRVDADAVRAEFARPAARHHNQAGFGEAVKQS